MSDIILTAENISKQYRLGVVGTGTFSHDLNRWWHTVRGKDDPYLKVGAVNDRSAKVSSEYVWALRDINFEVKRGEVLGIIGKNGAGKSTLLKILSRVTSPTTGVIKSRGRIASLLEVGTGFHPELTGRENIFLNGAILGMSKAEIQSKLDEIVAFSGCEMYIDTPTKRYSSGMTVRLAFAVAAHLEPEILVVDEVLAVGDAEFQKKAIGKMQDISQGEGRTVLFVSHNMASVQSLCTRGMLLENGNIKVTGTIEDVVDSYLNSDGKKNAHSHLKSINQDERSGNGRVRIDSVEFLRDNVGKLPITGKPVSIKFNLKNKYRLSLQDVQLDFRIDDHSGQRLLWLSTSLDETSRSEEANSVIFHFEKFPLNVGSYRATTYLMANKELADWAKNAFDFEVVEGLFYKTSQTVHRNQSKILTDFKVFYND